MAGSLVVRNAVETGSKESNNEISWVANLRCTRRNCLRVSSLAMSNGMDERKFEHVVKWCLTAQMDVILLTMGEQGWALVAVVCSASGFGLFFTRPAPPKGATEDE